MSVSNLYATTPQGVKFIDQRQIVVDDLTVNELLTVEGGTIYEGGIQVNGNNDPAKEIIMNINEQVLTSIGDTTGINFEALDGPTTVNLGAVVMENSSAVAGSTIASKISVKPATWDGASPIVSEMLCVGKDLLTTELGVFAKPCFGAGLAGNLGITNIEDYPAASTGKVYRFSLPNAGGTDVLTLMADQIAPSAGAGSPPAVISSHRLLTINPDGPALAPTSYDIAIGDVGAVEPLVAVQGASGVGQIYDTKYNPIGGPYVGLTAGYPTAPLATSAVPLTGLYTPTKTGPHAVSFQVFLNSSATIGTDHLGLNFNSFSGSPTQFSVLPSQLAFSATSVANYFTFNGIAYLTAGSNVAWDITPWGTGWSIPVIASIAPLC